MMQNKETVNDRGAETMQDKDSFMEETKQVQLWPCSPKEEISSWWLSGACGARPSGVA